MHTGNTMTTGEKRIAVLVLTICILFIAVFSVIDYCGFERTATADMYEDTLCAKVMWDHGTLFPDSFAFGNQLYVAATPVLCAVIYGMIGSLNKAMAIATSIMSVLILISLAYMLKPFVRNRLSVLLAALILMGCAFAESIVSIEECQLFFVMCSYYACYLITGFVVTGDYFRSLQSQEKRPAGLAISMVLCCAMGMQSLRQTCVTILPVLCYELIRLTVTKIRTGSFYPSKQYGPTFRAFLYAGANAAGVVFIKLLNIPQYTIYSGTSDFNGAGLSGKLHTISRALRAISGFDFISGDFAVFFATVFCVNVGLILFSLLRIIKSGSSFKPIYGMWLLLIISLAAVMAASVVTSVNLRPIYLFMYYPLVMLSGVITVDWLKPRLRCAVMIAVCLVYGLNCYFSYIGSLRNALDDSVTPQQEMCQLALDNGYKYIYGDYEMTANRIAVWSDGKLIGAGWDENIIFNVVPYVNVKNVYGLDDYAEGLFVFTDEDIGRAFEETEANGTTLTFVGSAGNYYAFSASNQLLYPLSWDPY